MRGITGGMKHAVLLACLALAAAACVADDAEPGPLGAVEVAPGGFIEIRSLSVLSGEHPDSIHRAIRLAIRDYGPIRGHDVALVGFHDLCVPGGGQTIGKTIAAEARVVGLIGSYCSVTAVEVAPQISAAGMVMISPGNTSSQLTSDLRGNRGPDHHDGYYRTTFNNLETARLVAEFTFHELGLRQVAAVHDGDPFTLDLAAAFADYFRDLGGEVVAFTVIRKDGTDAAAVVAEVAASGPDGLFFPLFPEAAGAFLVEVVETPALAGVTLVGASTLLESHFLARPDSEGLYMSAPSLEFGANTNQATGKSGDDVRAAFKAEHGASPETAYWAHAYDATTLLLSAIDEVAVEARGGLTIDRAALRRVLDALSGFEGLTGTLACDPFGDCGSGALQIVHHTDSSVTEVTEVPIVYRGSR